MAKFECRRVNLCDDALRARSQMHGLATAIVRRAFSRHPTLAFESMQQRNQSRFFNAEMRRDLGLS